MTLEQRLNALIAQLGADHKSQDSAIGQNTTAIGNLANLSTTAKASLVNAINEVFVIANTATGVINDEALAGTTNKTYSVDKILSLVATLKQDLLGGVPAETFDTLKEIADYIAGDQTATSGLISAVGKRVAFDQVQSLSVLEKQTARQNIDAYGSVEIGNYDADLVAAYNTAKA